MRKLQEKTMTWRRLAIVGGSDTERFHLGWWTIGITLLCLLPLALLALGVDLSTHGDSLTPEAVSQMTERELHQSAYQLLGGSFTHTILEWTAVCCAAFVGVLAFVNYRLAGEPSLPIIGMALVCAGGMDAFHTLAADQIGRASGRERV